jgi:phage-related protein
MYKRYRKLPVVVEAMQWTGRNYDDAEAFIDVESFGYQELGDESGARVVISTLEGEMTAEPGDWIIKGIKGEFYPCKPDIFEATYEPADA